MAHPSKELLFQCRLALGLTQKGFADLLGRTKRTIQRWEESGAVLIPSDAGPLARALYPVQPDLAAQIATAAGTTLIRLGIVKAPPGSRTATDDQIDAVVSAAAQVMGVTPSAIRPAIGAAFARARDEGIDVRAVADGIGVPERGPKT